MGPLLFLIYINNLSDVSEILDYILSADNTIRYSFPIIKSTFLQIPRIKSF